MSIGFTTLLGLDTAYAATAPSTIHDASLSSQLLSFLPTLVLFAAAVYFVMLRPQMKKERTLKALINSIKKR